MLVDVNVPVVLTGSAGGFSTVCGFNIVGGTSAALSTGCGVANGGVGGVSILSGVQTLF